jgi:L-threonylcarbamoyladenylate synthase
LHIKNFAAKVRPESESDNYKCKKQYLRRLIMLKPVLYNTAIGTDLTEACTWLGRGACVAIPTETVYGLAANALDAAAALRIFSIKNRPNFDPLIVHVGSLADVPRYAAVVPDVILHLMEHFWPGPLTVLLPKQPIVPDIVTSGLERVALRMPAHEAARRLLAQLSFPLAAPSANPFGYVSPTTPQHVYDQLQGKIPYILDGGPCSIGVESTIVGLEGDQLTVYRLGGLSLEAIEAVAGPVQVLLNQSSNPAAPGMLKSHYAPRKPFYFGEIAALSAQLSGLRLGVLSFGPSIPSGAVLEYNLSPSGYVEEAAKHLFAALRTLDQADIDAIVATPVPDEGLGRAVNDRLRRAAAK